MIRRATALLLLYCTYGSAYSREGRLLLIGPDIRTKLRSDLDYRTLNINNYISINSLLILIGWLLR